MMILKKVTLLIVLLSIVSCEQAKKDEFVLKTSDFQTEIGGKKTDLYLLKNEQIEVYITNYGGRIVSLLSPDKKGVMGDVVLGFKSIADYLKAKTPFHGCIIGRYGNRIAKGSFELDGTTHQLPINNNENHLHGGPDGFHNQVWDVVAVDENSIAMTYLSKDGEMGYPGNLSVDVTYAINEKNELSIAYKATTDKATPINLTNHAFFNLAGQAKGSINDHLLMINADHFTPVDEGLIPLGETRSVEGGPFDFRRAKTIGRDLNQQASNTQLRRGGGYDHNFVLNKDSQGRMSLAARVVDPKSGRQMDVFTEEPGIQFYGGNFMDGSDVGKYGTKFEYRASFALETQHYPDSPNQANFPNTILRPRETYQTQSIYRFSVAE
ncbi:MAG: galactose-1-epimerase [Bacteroidetes bacterium]|nr:galactose-1-epimerase [Bacteroidota bacterium]